MWTVTRNLLVVAALLLTGCGVLAGDGEAEVPRAEELAAQTGVTYQLGLDPEGALFRDFEVVSMPSTFLVDADGELVHRHAGLLTEPQLRGLLDEHLGVS